MELNGKALKDFWEWYLSPKQLKTYKTDSLFKYSTNKGNNVKISFLADSFAQRYGVYQDWFNDVGIFIGRDMILNYWLETTDDYEDEENAYQYDGMIESREKLIEKANDIYNRFK